MGKMPREPEFRAPTHPPMRLADDVLTIDAEPAADELTDEELEAATAPEIAEPDPMAWRMMDDAPRDGAVLEVKELPDSPDEVVIYARWYQTRQRNHALRQWVVTGWWANPLTKERLAFDPAVWRRPDGFSLPGVMA